MYSVALYISSKHTFFIRAKVTGIKRFRSSPVSRRTHGEIIHMILSVFRTRLLHLPPMITHTHTHTQAPSTPPAPPLTCQPTPQKIHRRLLSTSTSTTRNPPKRTIYQVKTPPTIPFPFFRSSHRKIHIPSFPLRARGVVDGVSLTFHSTNGECE